MMANNATENNVSWYVVAFLDLLGQQEKLRKLNALPNLNNQDEVETFKREIMQMYGPVKTLRTIFVNSVNSYLSANIEDEKLTEQERIFLQEFRNCPVHTQTVSDSVIAHISLRNDISRFPVRAINGILSATAFTFLSCLSKGWPIRGGIELGLAFNIDDDEVYGPALARAYTIESKVANYPRVVIGGELVRYLQAVASAQSDTIEQKANAFIANRCLNMLVEDYDGQAILDYLGDDIKKTLEQLPATPEIIQQAYDVVITESEKFKAEKNTKLGFRYTLFRNYFEARLPAWGYELKSE